MDDHARFTDSLKAFFLISALCTTIETVQIGLVTAEANNSSLRFLSWFLSTEVCRGSAQLKLNLHYECMALLIREEG